MRENYKIKTPTTTVSVELEKDVYTALVAMEDFSKLGRAEILNTALKRFISQHSDFLPPPLRAGALKAKSKAS